MPNTRSQRSRASDAVMDDRVSSLVFFWEVVFVKDSRHEWTRRKNGEWKVIAPEGTSATQTRLAWIRERVRNYVPMDEIKFSAPVLNDDLADGGVAGRPLTRAEWNSIVFRGRRLRLAFGDDPIVHTFPTDSNRGVTFRQVYLCIKMTIERYVRKAWATARLDAHPRCFALLVYDRGRRCFVVLSEPLPLLA